VRRAGKLPAWLDALAAARRYILFESYIVENDRIGRDFAALLAEKARAGVRVHVIVDWLGCWRALSLWRPVRDAGADVRVFNPPRISSPLGWLSRDHRKTIVVDGEVGFVSGLCVSERWLGNPKRRLEPWRDTGSKYAVRRSSRSSRRSSACLPHPARRSTWKDSHNREAFRRQARCACTSSQMNPTSPARSGWTS
jgi:Phosphatidylserine/phosphatidylglycerophosphate/cardiolipin synthases and related enzymes